jgi:hypothetical protein
MPRKGKTYPVSIYWKNRVIDRMHELVLNQAELARRIGATRATVSSLFRNGQQSALVPRIHEALEWPDPSTPEGAALFMPGPDRFSGPPGKLVGTYPEGAGFKVNSTLARSLDGTTNSMVPLYDIAIDHDEAARIRGITVSRARGSQLPPAEDDATLAQLYRLAMMFVKVDATARAELLNAAALAGQQSRDRAEKADERSAKARR